MAGFVGTLMKYSGFIIGDTMKNTLLNMHFCDFSNFNFVVGYFTTNLPHI